MRAKAAVLEEFKRGCQIREFHLSEPSPGAILVRIKLAGICGTDVHLIENRLANTPLPLILGHESVGEIFQVGEGISKDSLGNQISVGDLVCWEPSIPCGDCHWCRTGDRNLCEKRPNYGIDMPCNEPPYLLGGWAEYIYLKPRTYFFKVPHGISLEDVVSLGCAGPTAVNGVLFQTMVAPGDVVLIQGAGPVGIAAAMLSRISGARKVIMIDLIADRLRQAQTLGVGDCYLIFGEQTAPRNGADVVIECTGAPEAIPEGLEMVRTNGKYLVLGHYTDCGPAKIRPHLITRKQLKVYGSRGFAEVHFFKYVMFLPELKRRYDLPRMNRYYNLEDVNQALEDVRCKRVIKAALRMEE